MNKNGVSLSEIFRLGHVVSFFFFFLLFYSVLYAKGSWQCWRYSRFSG